MENRISTQQFYQNQFGVMSANQQKINKLQQQISTNEKYQTPDENPVATFQIRSLNYSLQQLDGFQNNSTLLLNRNTLIENSAKSAINNLQQISEFITQVQSGTLSNENRQSIAEQLQGITGSLVNTANTQDANGNFIFSGFKTTIPAYAEVNGVISYQGDQGSTSLQINTSTQITYNDSGYEVFENIKNGNGTFVTSQGNVTNTGTGVIKPGALINPSQYVPDDYTVQFVTNGSGQLAYTITGASTGQIVPALPAAIPANAPAFVSGQSIVANGMQFSISGQPNVGDEFVIQPSQPQSIFTTLDNLIHALKQSPSNPTQLADQQNIINQASASVQQAFQHLSSYVSQIGTRLNTLNESTDFNTALKTQLETMKSNLGDADMTEVVLQLNQQTLALQLAQQAFIKVQNLSLINFLGSAR